MVQYIIFGLFEKEFEVNFDKIKKEIIKIANSNLKKFNFKSSLNQKIRIDKEYYFNNDTISIGLSNFKDIEDETYEDITDYPKEFKKYLNFSFEISETIAFDIIDRTPLYEEVFNYIYKNYKKYLIELSFCDSQMTPIQYYCRNFSIFLQLQVLSREKIDKFKDNLEQESLKQKLVENGDLRKTGEIYVNSDRSRIFYF